MRHIVRIDHLAVHAETLHVAVDRMNWSSGVGRSLEGRRRIEVLAAGNRILAVEVGTLGRKSEGIGCMGPT